MPSDPSCPLHGFLLDHLREGLAESGMSQAELARATGYSIKHINQVINGHNTAPIKTWDYLLLMVGRRDAVIGKKD